MNTSELNQAFWDKKYIEGKTGWDIGSISTPLKMYFDQLTNKDLKILIPGCGNAYEAEYLYLNGFKNVFLLDISPYAIQNFKSRCPNFPESNLILGNFFDHNQQYDLIVEQTFFCALHPSLRANYVDKMYELLKPSGKLVGVLFNIPLNETEPPFGGHQQDYRKLFETKFHIQILDLCYNSIPPRKNNEVFIKFVKKEF